MAFHKGDIAETIEAYELKQSQIAIEKGIVGRYAGREIKGVIYPDVILNNGFYFIPNETGNDTILKEDIKQEELIN